MYPYFVLYYLFHSTCAILYSGVDEIAAYYVVVNTQDPRAEQGILLPILVVVAVENENPIHNFKRHSIILYLFLYATCNILCNVVWWIPESSYKYATKEERQRFNRHMIHGWARGKPSPPYVKSLSNKKAPPYFDRNAPRHFQWREDPLSVLSWRFQSTHNLLLEFRWWEDAPLCPPSGVLSLYS